MCSVIRRFQLGVSQRETREGEGLEPPCSRCEPKKDLKDRAGRAIKLVLSQTNGAHQIAEEP
jgi:hypothetical protein